MSGVPWVRLDTSFASNPKFLYLIEDKKHRAIVVWTASLAYAGGQGTDGFIPAAALPLLHGTPGDAASLVDVGLWHTAKGGWQINGWCEFQLSTTEMNARRKKAQEAAAARWGKRNGNDPHD
jgi:hypothetical protein